VRAGVRPREVWADNDNRRAAIYSETNRHEELVLAAAAAGKHLFVEEASGMGTADARRMARAIERAGVFPDGV